MPKFNTAQLVAFIKAHAVTNYQKGWDVVVETMTDEEIAERLGAASSQKAAIAAFAGIVGAFNEQRDMHRNEALLMGAEPTEDEIASGKVDALLNKTDPESPTADNLTDLEKRVLVAHLEAGIDCNGAETLDAMLSDNMTWSDVKETSQRTAALIKWRDHHDPEPARWPRLTVLLPVYREPSVIPDLAAAMRALDYPSLEIVLLVEEDDHETRAALDFWPFQVLVVPDGKPRTKPRAVNFGLLHTRGEVVVVFDAEDRPSTKDCVILVCGMSNPCV